MNEADPKKGTGKKPKSSGRRLYTDENPKDTVSVKFSTVQDIKDTLSKESFKSKSHKRQSQIINLIHQRVRVAKGRTKDPVKKKRLAAAFKYISKRKEASKRKTQRMKNESLYLEKIILEELENILDERCQKGYKTHPKRKTKKMFGRTYRNCVKAEGVEEDDILDEELEEDLNKWFKQNKGTGWVDCNTCRKDKKTGRKKCSPCGRKKRSGGKRKRYPACRPTPAACGKRGKWGKKSKAEKRRKKNRKQ